MSLIKALIHPVTPFQQNAPILFCEESKKCAFIDPGGDLDILLGAAKENNLIPERIFLTHGHADHAGAASELANMLSLKIEGPHEEDLFLLESLESQGKMFGMQGFNKTLYKQKKLITDKKRIIFTLQIVPDFDEEDNNLYIKIVQKLISTNANFLSLLFV